MPCWLGCLSKSAPCGLQVTYVKGEGTITKQGEVTVKTNDGGTEVMPN